MKYHLEFKCVHSLLNKEKLSIKIKTYEDFKAFLNL